MVTVLSTSNDFWFRLGFSLHRSQKLTALSYLIHITLPLLVSAYIYTFFRPSGIGVQEILKAIVGNNVLGNLQAVAMPAQHLGDWIIYSMPAALWTYSMSLLGILLHIDRKNRFYAIAFLPLTLTIGLEGLQYFHLTDGTFDIMDVVAGIIGYLGAIIYSKNHHTVLLAPSNIKIRRCTYALLFACVYIGDVWTY